MRRHERGLKGEQATTKKRVVKVLEAPLAGAAYGHRFCSQHADWCAAIPFSKMFDFIDDAAVKVCNIAGRPATLAAIIVVVVVAVGDIDELQ